MPYFPNVANGAAFFPDYREGAAFFPAGWGGAVNLISETLNLVPNSVPGDGGFGYYFNGVQGIRDGGVYDGVNNFARLIINNGNVAQTAGVDFMRISAVGWSDESIAATFRVEPNQTYTMGVDIRSSSPCTLQLQAQPIRGSGAGSPVTPATGDSFVTTDQFVTYYTTFTVPAAGTPAIRFDIDAGADQTVLNGTTFDFRRAFAVKGAQPIYFSPSTPSTNLARYGWLGLPDGSISYRRIYEAV